MKNLSKTARKILNAEPPGWEYYLFAQVLEEEIATARQRSRLVEPVTAQHDRITDPQALVQWCLARPAELEALLPRLPSLLDALGDKAFGPIGERGDPETIQTLAQEIALVYRHAMEWERDVLATPVAERFRTVRKTLADLSTEIVAPIAEFPDALRAHLDEIEKTGPEPGTRTSLTLELGEPDTDALLTALASALGTSVEELTGEVDAFEAWYQDEVGDY